MPKVVYVVAPTGFRDEELFDTKKTLDSKGVEGIIASTRKGALQGQLGGSAEAEKSLNEVTASDFDGVVFIGGPGVEEHKLYENSTVLSLAKEFASAGKLVAAICIAPRILAKAGLLAGKNATMFPDDDSKRILEEGGAEISSQNVVADGKIVTGDGPSAAKAFAEKIASLL